MGHRGLRLFLLVFYLFIHVQLVAKPPQLTHRDTRIKVDEILKAHVSHQQLSGELIARAIQNFIEELDPLKTYFLESDISSWINPDPAILQKTLEGYKKEDFSTFEIIHAKMIEAISRRNALENELAALAVPSDAKPIELKDVKWAQDKEELIQRLLHIKALQLHSADKIMPENKDQFFQRIQKRRLSRESELLGANAKEREQIILSYVLKATSAALDSQTMYFTPSEANQFMIQVQQRLFGIGAQLRDDLNGFTIVRIVEGGPASMNTKLKVGDKIIAVNQEPVVGMEITEAVELIRGPQGSSILLTVLRDVKDTDLGQTKEEKHEIEIVRGEVVLKESRLETTFEPYGDGVIGILHLFSFYQDSKNSSSSDLAAAIASLKQEHNLKGIILDLRNNAGGLLPQAVTVTGLFISKGVVVSVKDNTGQIQHLRNLEAKKAWDGPLLVLTNRLSASAAEIVAQTLQDYGRAFVIGDAETFGKGTFQSFTLETSNFGKVNPKGEYKVTRGRYYTVSGKSPQLVGVKSDIVVPGAFSEMEIGEKYSKFPLETDQIYPSFDDALADVPPLHRGQFERLYKKDMQPVQKTYLPYMEPLKHNSKERIALNKNYQNLLKEIAKQEPSYESFELFGQTDLQLLETLNIMKDFILLLEKDSAHKAA